jgi:hypothetical protein
LNLRPSGYEPDELPDCSTPHLKGRAFYTNANEWKAGVPTNPCRQGSRIGAEPGMPALPDQAGAQR